jgi:hypothetical protein
VVMQSWGWSRPISTSLVSLHSLHTTHPPLKRAHTHHNCCAMHTNVAP